MARAVSTVLDVAVCLLLVGLAVAALTAAVPGDERPVSADSDAVAASLTTTTATVQTASGRAVHGTMAEHLVHATVVGTTLDGNGLTESRYADAVSRETERRIPTRTHVTARWEPYPDSRLHGAIDAGPKPLASADIAVTTRTVHAGIDPPQPAAADSFEALAVAVAEAYISRLFPEERLRTQLLDPRTAHSSAERYRSVAATLGIDIEDELEAASANQANQRLSNALATQLESELRSSYGTPTAAADALDPGSVQVTVRRWEP